MNRFNLTLNIWSKIFFWLSYWNFYNSLNSGIFPCMNYLHNNMSKKFIFGGRLAYIMVKLQNMGKKFVSAGKIAYIMVKLNIKCDFLNFMNRNNCISFIWIFIIWLESWWFRRLSRVRCYITNINFNNFYVSINIL